VCNNAEWHNGRRQLILYILLISEVAIFTYEIKHLDPLTQTLSLSIQLDSFFLTHYTENVAMYNPLSMIFFGF
jgi:hypothetical protein